MKKDERREKLERIRSARGGGQRVAEIYNSGQRDDDGILTPASFVQAMVECILKREYTNGMTDRRRVEVGDFVRTADGVLSTVVTIDDAYCNGYVRLHDDMPGVGLKLVTIASLERTDGPPQAES